MTCRRGNGLESGWLTDRLGARLPMTVGVLFTTAGLVFLSRLDVATSQSVLLMALVVTGIGTTVFDPANGSALMGSVPQGRLGTAAASIATARQIGLSMGHALGAATFAARAGGYAGISAAQILPAALPPTALAAGIRDALLVSAAVAILAVFFTSSWRWRRGSRAATPP